MRRALIPYAGKPVWRRGHRDFRMGRAAKKEQGDNLYSISAVPSDLGEEHWPEALELFRSGHDSVAIASVMSCTPAAAANALARIMDRVRSQ